MTREEAEAIVSALVTLRESATDEQALAVPALYPKWRADVDYAAETRVVYNDILYKVITAHKSQSDWTPDAAPSLFTKVLIADPNVIPEWEQPESTNPYMAGDKVTHNGFTWKSLVDNNVWEPTDAVPTLWEKVTE